MKKGRAETSFISIILLIVIANYALASDNTGSDYQKTFSDSANKFSATQTPVQRIIVLNENAAEAVVILGSGDKIVGAVDQVIKKGNYYSSIKDAASVGSRTEIDYEKIVKVAENEDRIEPDIIVGSSLFSVGSRVNLYSNSC